MESREENGEIINKIEFGSYFDVFFLVYEEIFGPFFCWFFFSRAGSKSIRRNQFVQEL